MMTPISSRPQTSNASDIQKVARSGAITDAVSPATSTPSLQVEPSRQSVIPRPPPNTPTTHSAYAPAFPARFAKVLSHLSLKAPSLQALELKLRLAPTTDWAQSAKLQSQAFTEHVQQLTEHLALLHLEHEEDALENRPTDAAGIQALAASRRSLAEYANQSSTAISGALNTFIGNLEEKVKKLQPPEGATIQAAINTLQEILKKSSKSLDAVLKHTGLNTTIEDLNTAHQSLGFSGWAGPIAAASIPQFIASMTHLGYARSAIDQAADSRYPDDAALLTRSAIVGTVAGIAHESVNAVVKPAFQAFFQATSLAEKANIVGLKPVDANTLIPDPLPFKKVDGRLASKNEAELTQELSSVKEQRTRLADKKALGTSTHVLGEMVPYTSFGGAQAVRQLLNDLTRINGTTLTARALASGAAGAMSAGAQTAIQLGTTFTDDKNRTFPVYAPDRAPKNFSSELGKGLDLRESKVRTAFYSKSISGIQSAIFNGSLPSVAQPTPTATEHVAPSPLTRSQIVKNALLAAAGSISYLSTLYSSQASAGETAARKAAQSSAPRIFDRTETARRNVFAPGRPDLPHMSSKAALGGGLHALENATHMGRGVLQIAPQVLVDITKALDAGAVKGGEAYSRATTSRTRPSTVATDKPVPMQVLSSAIESAGMEDETQRLRAAEEGQAGPSGTNSNP